MTITTTTNDTNNNEPLPMNEAEQFFYINAKLRIEDDFEARLEAFSQAGAEALGFQAGLIFEWSIVYDEGFQTEHLVGRTGSEVVFSEDWFWEFDDDQRRIIEADMIRLHLADRLLKVVDAA